MKVTHYFTIGNLTVPSSWIAIILAMFIAYIAIRLKYGKTLSILFADLMFYFIIVWKLSVIITDFKTVIKFPLSIIYFNGGKLGVLLGLIAVSIKIIFEQFKGRIGKETIIALLTGTIFIQAMYQICMVALNDGQLLVQAPTVILFGALALFTWFYIEKFQHLLVQFILLFIVLHLFIGAVQGDIFQTPVIATVYISTFLMGLLFFYRKTGINTEGSH